MTISSREPGHRQRQALATRRTVAAAARPLFAERGYNATSIEAISLAARVHSQTIYSAFGSKPAILEEVRLQWVAGARVSDLHAEAMALADPGQRLRRAAHWTRRQFELGIDVIEVYLEAARSDERVRGNWAAAMAGREAAIRALLEPMRRSFRRGLRLGHAIDLYVALTTPAIYRTLVLDRRWAPAAYERWLAEGLVRDLLG